MNEAVYHPEIASGSIDFSADHGLQKRNELQVQALRKLRSEGVLKFPREETFLWMQETGAGAFIASIIDQDEKFQVHAQRGDFDAAKDYLIEKLKVWIK
jgi:hypothetical protein